MMKTYRVEGMTCEKCSAAVTRSIQTLSPGATVDVRLDSETVTVGGLDDQDTIAQAIEQAGFRFVGLAESRNSTGKGCCHA